MEWKLLTREDYVTTRWSGGTTTQLAIEPAEASYANRDFLWRLSSAGVEAEHSDFTSLPDYHRMISTLSGELELKVGEGDRFTLAPYQVFTFDGGIPVESWGTCTDFNLMLRKGRCQGNLQALKLSPGKTLNWTVPAPVSGSSLRCAAALYCGEGSFELPQTDFQVQAGQLLLCREVDGTAITLASTAGANILASVILPANDDPV